MGDNRCMIYGKKELVDDPEYTQPYYKQETARGFVEDERYFIKNGSDGFKEVVKYKEIDYNTFERQVVVETWLDDDDRYSHFLSIPFIIPDDAVTLNAVLPFPNATIGEIIFERQTHFIFEDEEEEDENQD